MRFRPATLLTLFAVLAALPLIQLTHAEVQLVTVGAILGLAVPLFRALPARG